MWKRKGCKDNMEKLTKTEIKEVERKADEELAKEVKEIVSQL